MEDRPLKLQLVSEFARIHEVSVMRKRHISFDVIDNDGLRIVSAVRTCRTVAYMTDGNHALAEAVEYLRGEHVVHQSRIFIASKNPVVVYDNTAGFLTAVLERKQPVIRGVRDIGFFVRIYPENTAFFSDTAHISSDINRKHASSFPDTRPQRRPCRGGNDPCPAFRR